MLPLDVLELVKNALREDLAQGDITTDATVSPSVMGRGVLKAKSDLVLSGLDLVHEVYTTLASHSVSVKLHKRDGEYVAAGALIAELEGPFATLLKGERLALNFLMHLSGVATLSHAAQKALAGGPTRVLDTRKTLPGLRWLEKRAVRDGGGSNHRFNLADGVLIKDNHIAACGSVSEAIIRARSFAPHLMKIECEVQNEAQLDEALAAGADVLLLDNMSDEQLRAAVKRVAGRAKTEASGNMTLERLRRLADVGLDFVSMGALTHSASAADLSLKIAFVSS